MDYSLVYESQGSTIVADIKNLDLDQTLDCGQSFRWRRLEDASWEGVAFGRYCRLSLEHGGLVFHGTPLQEFEAVWRDYFDLTRDYCAVKKLLGSDETMAKAIAFAPGLRVLRQEPWEALCTFILSQNNNIPRIKGLVERLCETFGAEVPAPPGHLPLRSFPSAKTLADLEVEDLAPVRAGFRAKYILDAARRVASGQLLLEPLYTMELEEARIALRTIHGVGPKVAECALLYGFGRVECMPVDVWIRRALDYLYPEGMPGAFAPVAGLAQQYLFHYVRHAPDALPETVAKK